MLTASGLLENMVELLCQKPLLVLQRYSQDQVLDPSLNRHFYM